jgi:RNA polymerase sigma factor (TIGR02999 family)
MMWRLLKRLVKSMEQDAEIKPGQGDVTVELNRRGGAESQALLAARLYPELKRIASAHMRRERPDHTLQATALVNELYLHMLQRPKVGWTDRHHFFLAASQAMHRLLVDHARARRSQKRGGSWIRLDTEAPGLKSSDLPDMELLELDKLLKRLAKQEPRMASVVELKFFGGLTFSEIGDVLGIDERTAKRDWTLARGWLRGQLEPNDGGRMGED